MKDLERRLALYEPRLSVSGASSLRELITFQKLYLTRIGQNRPPDLRMWLA